MTVAVTPSGRADAVHRVDVNGRVKEASGSGDDNHDFQEEVFVMPVEEMTTFDDFLDRLEAPKGGEVPYLQKQVRVVRCMDD